MPILKELLETSSSSTSTTNVYKYDVFLSFRGTDTRYNFTDHLYNALVSANLTTFLDDEKIPIGEELKPELESAIKGSRASIIVLSENYASSRWCLDELVLILQQNKTVIPIFYHVDPTDVWKQQSTFGDAMTMHKQRMEEETDAEKRSQLAHKMEIWKKALTQVADLKGKDAKKNRKETEFIKEIVNDVYRRLGVPLRSSQQQLIGADYNIGLINSWLKDGSSYTADIFTILGIGGIGKTSLARYIYGIHCRDEFDRSSFIGDISRKCLLDVQKEFLDDISQISSLPIHDVYAYTSMIENTLACKKVFVVLDDIDSLKQLDALLGNRGFHPGSKIIVTTKDGSLTERCALFNPQVQPKHTQVLLEGLYETKALELLYIHAFECRHKPKKGYEKVANELIRYCGGHPLALEVLGRSLRNRDVAYWEGCIKRLKKGPDSRTQSALQMSFDSLSSENDKELFKHIACFFVGADKDVTEIILEACDIDTRSGITNLMDRCLLSNKWRNKLMMHQLVQEMGRDLVRQESPRSWERSRLCCHDESFMVLKQKREKENLLGLVLDMRMLDKEKLRGSFELKTNSLNEMDRLMLLQLNYVQIDGFFEKIPEELRWLCMHGFPLKSIVIPSNLLPENLIVLDMSYSKIESFGIAYSNPQPPMKRQKLLRSLKILDVSFCEQLHSLGGFLELPALERLIVKNCTSLFDVCESIEQCVELVFVDMSYCYKLKNLPILIGKLKKVKTLLLDGCNSHESQTETGDMDLLCIGMFVDDIDTDSQTSLSTIMDKIPSPCKSLVISLPCSLVSLSLKSNNLSNESFPNDLSSLSMLKVLCLDGNPLVSMPNYFRSLPRLEELTMCSCNSLTSIEHPPRTLRKLAFSCDRNSSNLNKVSLLRKILFDPEMSPLNYHGFHFNNKPFSSFVIEGMVKIQPIGGVGEKVLHSLGWTDLELLKERRMRIGLQGSQTQQMYYEFGIFSTIYKGEEMPAWISNRSKGSSISFTIPSSPKKLRGLNFCCVKTCKRFLNEDFCLPLIKISNITKGHIWMYIHYISRGVSVGGKCLMYLSHWMFGMNEMESGDHVTITVKQNIFGCVTQETSKCGVRVVYDEGKMEEDALDYYKSWNHIIGGDLSPFQTTTGEYILTNMRYIGHPILIPHDGTVYSYKDNNGVAFKAFSQRKSHILNPASQKSSILQMEEEQEEVRNEAEAGPIQHKRKAPSLRVSSDKKKAKGVGFF